MGTCSKNGYGRFKCDRTVVSYMLVSVMPRPGSQADEDDAGHVRYAINPQGLIPQWGYSSAGAWVIVLRVAARVAKQPLADAHSTNVVEEQAQGFGDAMGSGQSHHHAAMVHEQQGLEETPPHTGLAAVVSVSPDVA